MPAPDSPPSMPQTSTVPAPDYSQGALSPLPQKILSDWLILKWGKGNPKGLPKCERCGGEGATWIMGQHVVTPIQFVNGSLQLGGVVYPSVAITCSNCGNTISINAIAAGVLIRGEGGKLSVPEEKNEASNG